VAAKLFRNIYKLRESFCLHAMPSHIYKVDVDIYVCNVLETIGWN